MRPHQKFEKAWKAYIAAKNNGFEKDLLRTRKTLRAVCTKLGVESPA